MGLCMDLIECCTSYAANASSTVMQRKKINTVQTNKNTSAQAKLSMKKI